jgi:hypothetical protein
MGRKYIITFIASQLISNWAGDSLLNVSFFGFGRLTRNENIAVWQDSVMVVYLVPTFTNET